VVNDIDRPLTERGVNNSYEMAKRMVDRGTVPGALFSSPANRALHTAVIMSRVWELPEDALRIRQELYLPETDDVHSFLMGLPDEMDAVAIYGHNPAFTDFANMYLSEKVDTIPTAGVVVLTFNAGSWNEIPSAAVDAEYFDFPKRKG